MQNVHHTNIIKVGNSKGIRIPKEYLKALGEKVVIQPTKEGLLILPDLSTGVPPRKYWEALFAKAVANGEIPEDDVFEGMENDADQTDWQW
jgi:antitoxin MazE